MSASRIVVCAIGVVAVALAGCSQTSTTQPSGTVVVVASPVVSPRAVQSPSAAGPVQITAVQITPQDAVIVLQNTGGPSTQTTIDLQDWNLQVGSTTVILPSGTRVEAGQNLSIHAGPQPGVAPSPGSALSPVPLAKPSAEIYLGPNGATLRDAITSGAQVELIDTKGVIVSQYTIP